MPTSRGWGGCELSNDTIYIFGGYNAQDDEFHDVIEKYSVQDDEWLDEGFINDLVLFLSNKE